MSALLSPLSGLRFSRHLAGPMYPPVGAMGRGKAPLGEAAAALRPVAKSMGADLGRSPPARLGGNAKGTGNGGGGPHKPVGPAKCAEEGNFKKHKLLWGCTCGFATSFADTPARYKCGAPPQSGRRAAWLCSQSFCGPVGCCGVGLRCKTRWVPTFPAYHCLGRGAQPSGGSPHIGRRWWLGAGGSGGYPFPDLLAVRTSCRAFAVADSSRE